MNCLRAAVLLLAVTMVTAVSPPPDGADVSSAQGAVVVVRGDTGAQVPGVAQTPLHPGDSVATADAAHADVDVSGVARLHLGPLSEVRLVSLQPGSREMQLATGTVDLEAFAGTKDPPALDTPTVTVHPNGPGRYRITVTTDGKTSVSVAQGTATIETPNGSHTVGPGSTTLANGLQ